jgi:hypothetical protein
MGLNPNVNGKNLRHKGKAKAKDKILFHHESMKIRRHEKIFCFVLSLFRAFVIVFTFVQEPNPDTITK